MSEPTVTSPEGDNAGAEPDVAAQSAGETPVEEPKDWKAEATKWAALSKKNEDRAKANAEAAKRLKQLEDAEKSESQRLSEALEAAQAETAKERRDAMVLKVAMTHKLDADDLDLLHGETEEELTARAQRIQSLKAAGTASTGAGSADQGAKPPAKTDLPSQIKAAEAKGDVATAMRLKNQQAASLITST